MTIWGVLAIALVSAFLMLVSHYYGFWQGYRHGQIDMKKVMEIIMEKERLHEVKDNEHAMDSNDTKNPA